MITYFKFSMQTTIIKLGSKMASIRLYKYLSFFLLIVNSPIILLNIWSDLMIVMLIIVGQSLGTILPNFLTQRIIYQRIIYNSFLVYLPVSLCLFFLYRKRYGFSLLVLILPTIYICYWLFKDTLFG